MMYIIFSKDEIDGLSLVSDIHEVYLEIDNDGAVLREVGMDGSGSVVYHSDNRSPGKMALFDVALIDLNELEDEISKEEFELKWKEKTKPDKEKKAK